MAQQKQDSTNNKENETRGDQEDKNTKKMYLKNIITLHKISPVPVASETRKRKSRQTISGVLTTSSNLT
ncbi:unnamed protein product [Diabrotica balteata]|uniref:Uncharacterized protein n=1 Tax=Diabrotica balteata TaxID=107213 RepID=A0A9N9XCZ3_DIABA|nr:unnamed protein product [Diabrotica balteata]